MQSFQPSKFVNTFVYSRYDCLSSFKPMQHGCSVRCSSGIWTHCTQGKMRLRVCCAGGATFSLMGMATLPMPLAPLGFLMFTYLVIPKSSLVGHLSGILVGYLIASGALDPLNLYWMLSISAWMGIGTSFPLSSIVDAQLMKLPCVLLPLPCCWKAVSDPQAA